MKSRKYAVFVPALMLITLIAPSVLSAQLIEVPRSLLRGTSISMETKSNRSLTPRQAAWNALALHFHVSIKTPAEDRAFSEFNHHLAGGFLLVIGILAFLSRSTKRLRFLGKVWPFFFILPGIYLAFMSDPDVWPMGRQGLVEAFITNPEAAEHKTYAALLLALGILEFQRARGKLGGFLAAWSFPALAVFGAVLLVFHRHTVTTSPEDMTQAMKGMEGMGHANHMMTETMMKIQREHIRFSIAGAGVAISKFLYDGEFWKNRVLPFIWPVSISVLGVMLLLYTE